MYGGVTMAWRVNAELSRQFCFTKVATVIGFDNFLQILDAVKDIVA